MHLWIADDFEDMAPELSPHELLATIALADASLEADTSLSWYFLRHCADTILVARVKKTLPYVQKTGGAGTTSRTGNESDDRP